MTEIQSGIAKTMIECVVLVAILPGGNRGGNFVESFRIETQHLAHFAPRHAAAVSNDVRGHRCAPLAVTFVQILNDALALIAAGQIEIDVRPFTTFFGKESFKQQTHADRIDRCDAERIADRAVRR